MEAMEMSSVADLPPELLLDIFGYFSLEELVDVIQNVCSSWRRVVRHLSVWKDYVYSPEQDVSGEEAGRFVEKCPMVKHICACVRASDDPTDFVSAVVRNCSDVHTFCVKFTDGFSTVPQIDALFEAFPNLEAFTVTVDSANAPQVLRRIGRCENLRKLIVFVRARCEVSFEPIVKGCPSLEELYVEWRKMIKSEYYYILKEMKHRLVSLRFSTHHQGTQQAVDLLGSFAQLEYLDLYHDNRFGPVNFWPLASIKTLQCLEFFSGAGRTADVKSFFEVLLRDPFPLLQEIVIEFIYCEIPRDIVKELCLCYPRLKSLKLYNGFCVERHSFQEISRLKHLESLSYCSNYFITDEDTKHIARCRMLKHLDLGECYQLTDETVVNLASCKTLESLNLRRCAIEGQTLHVIPEHLTRLSYLNIASTDVRRRDAVKLARKMPLTKVVC